MWRLKGVVVATLSLDLRVAEPITSPEEELPHVSVTSDLGMRAALDTERDGVSPADGQPLESHDPGGDGNLSGVSDISSESMNGEPLAVTGPKTPPPPSHETTPSSDPAARVSDISSDNMEPYSPIDDGISETNDGSPEAPGNSGVGSEGVVVPTGCLTAEAGDLSQGKGVVPWDAVDRTDDSRVQTDEGSTDGAEGYVGGAGSQVTPPEVMEYEGIVPQRPPPLDSLAGGVVPPPSPPSTPSKTPGKRKVG